MLFVHYFHLLSIFRPSTDTDMDKKISPGRANGNGALALTGDIFYGEKIIWAEVIVRSVVSDEKIIHGL